MKIYPLNTKIILSDHEEYIGRRIVNAAYAVPKELGPGLLEKVYESCMAHVLQTDGLKVRRQVSLPIVFQEIEFIESLRLDLYIEDIVICEIKAVDQVNPVWQAQVLSHLKLTGHHLGYLINFNVPLIKDGIRRFIK